MTVSTEAACPICGRMAAAKLRPFCSLRCTEVDLGRWLTGQYVVPGEAHEAGEESGAAAEREG